MDVRLADMKDFIRAEAYEHAAKIADDAWNSSGDIINAKLHAQAIAGNIRALAKEVE